MTTLKTILWRTKGFLEYTPRSSKLRAQFQMSSSLNPQKSKPLRTPLKFNFQPTLILQSPNLFTATLGGLFKIVISQKNRNQPIATLDACYKHVPLRLLTAVRKEQLIGKKLSGPRVIDMCINETRSHLKIAYFTLRFLLCVSSQNGRKKTWLQRWERSKHSIL